jgi:hypothetical protein
MSEHHNCIDCGINTHPGAPTRIEAEQIMVDQGSIPFEYNERSEVYMVRDAVWKAAGMAGYGGCLCIGCLERRLGRMLRPKDFNRKHPFSQLPGTERLLSRRGKKAQP